MSSGYGGERGVNKYSGFIDTFGPAPLYRLLARSMSVYILCNKASIKLLDWEDHVPVFAPDYIAVLDGELLKVFGFKV